MYDGSALPFEENLRNTKLVCEVAHACNVSVEAELGSLAAGENSMKGVLLMWKPIQILWLRSNLLKKPK